MNSLMQLDMMVVVIFIAVIFLSRKMSEKANKYITEDKRDLLMQEFSGMRKYSILPLVIMVGAVFVSYKYFQLYPVQLLSAYLVIIILYLTVFNYIIYRRLKKIGMESDYLKYFIISRILPFVAVITVFALILYKNIGKL